MKNNEYEIVKVWDVKHENYCIGLLDVKHYIVWFGATPMEKLKAVGNTVERCEIIDETD